MKLGEVLDRKGHQVISARQQETVLEAVHKLVDHNIGALPVLDDSGKLAGIFSERDVLRLCVTSRVNLGTLALHQYMTRNLVCVSPDETVDTALSIMTERRIRHLPVVDGGKLAGIVSQGDLVKQKLEEVQHETRQLTDYVMGKYPR